MIQRALIGLALLLAACGPAPEQNELTYTVTGDAIPDPLTTTPGDVQRGKAIFTTREAGHCVLCHQVTGLDVPFQGDVGPALTEVGQRLTAGQLRLRIVDYQQVRPGTLMPSYYRVDGLHQVEGAYAGAPILTAQAVEDLIAYLSTLPEVRDET